MACHKYFLIPLVSIIAISTLVTSPARAQNAPQDYVNTHNTPRGQVSVGLVAWNSTLAAYAQNYANSRIADCALTPSSGPYGENLGKGPSGAFTGTAAVNQWANEKQYYDHTNNVCTGGTCVHYTQAVWYDSTQIGCARVQCNSGWYYVVCSYYQLGNRPGESPY